VLLGADDPVLSSFLGTQVGGLATPVSRTIPFDTFFLPYTSAQDQVTVGRSATARMTLINTGIALSVDATFLSLRVEVPGFPNTVAPWTSFYQGMSASRLSSAGSHGPFLTRRSGLARLASSRTRGMSGFAAFSR
jgi:hypothetical protein